MKRTPSKGAVVASRVIVISIAGYCLVMAAVHSGPSDGRSASSGTDYPLRDDSTYASAHDSAAAGSDPDSPAALGIPLGNDTDMSPCSAQSGSGPCYASTDTVADLWPARAGHDFWIDCDQRLHWRDATDARRWGISVVPGTAVCVGVSGPVVAHVSPAQAILH